MTAPSQSLSPSPPSNNPLFQTAQQFERENKPEEAELAYRRILARDPYNPDALHLLGMLCFRTGRRFEGLDFVRRSLLASPDNPSFHANHAILLGTSGRFEEAIAAIQKAIALRPDHAPSHNNLGVTLEKAGRFDEAVAAFTRAAELSPTDPALRAHRGNALRKAGKLDLAEAAYHGAIVLNSDFEPAWQNLAGVLQEQARHAEALEAFRRSLALSPGDAGQRSSFLYAIHYNPTLSPKEIFDEHLAWAKQHETPLAEKWYRHDKYRSSKQRLRIGYLSPDFRRHSVATFFEPLAAHHDQSKFEVILYSATDKPDDFTAKLRSMADGFRDISHLSDEKAAQQIYQDQVDILVDLTGHMGGSRLSIFARKPAPVQVTYVGHPNTTGLAAMDYRLTDPHLDPLNGGSDALHTEQLIRLPTTFGCYQQPEEDLSVSPPAFEKNGYITFGCLNNPAKITEPAIRLWCKILRAVPNSKLLLLGEPGVKHLDQLFASEGIGSDRALRIGRFRRQAYLEAFNRIDINLDCFPYNGQTTSCDGFWMGVLMVALAGESYVSRMGLSLLTNLKLPDLVAHSPEEYVTIAARLAADRSKLAELRRSMRERLSTSPVMDGQSLARAIENVYRQVWQNWCDSQ